MYASFDVHSDEAVTVAIANRNKPKVQAALRRIRAAAMRARGGIQDYEHFKLLATACFLEGERTWEAGEIYREIGQRNAQRLLEGGHEDAEMLQLHQALGEFLAAHGLIPALAYSPRITRC
jgi:hypothetical protein